MFNKWTPEERRSIQEARQEAFREEHEKQLQNAIIAARNAPYRGEQRRQALKESVTKLAQHFKENAKKQKPTQAGGHWLFNEKAFGMPKKRKKPEIGFF